MSSEILVKFRKISLTALLPSHHHLAIQWVRRVNGTQLGQKYLGYFELLPWNASSSMMMMWIGTWNWHIDWECEKYFAKFRVLGRVPVARVNTASVPRTACCVGAESASPLQYPNISWELFYSNQRERGQPHPHTSSAGVWTEKISTLERKLDLRLTNLDLLFIENVSLLIAATGGILTGWTIELLTEFRETFGKGPW